MENPLVAKYQAAVAAKEDMLCVTYDIKRVWHVPLSVARELAGRPDATPEELVEIVKTWDESEELVSREWDRFFETPEDFRFVEETIESRQAVIESGNPFPNA